MPVEINLDHLITKDEFLEVYRIFCQCYDIEINEKDEDRFLKWHYNSLLENPGYVDHRPFFGAKFFCHKMDNKYDFHGYSSPEDPDWDKKDELFQKKILQYFSKKPEQ